MTWDWQKINEVKELAKKYDIEVSHEDDNHKFKMTNFEKIKKMELEEMSKFLSCDYCAFLGVGGCYGIGDDCCDIGIKTWLEQEVE